MKLVFAVLWGSCSMQTGVRRGAVNAASHVCSCGDPTPGQPRYFHPSFTRPGPMTICRKATIITCTQPNPSRDNKIPSRSTKTS
ncbi:hypothetical protein T440DRAFT_252685 [Plenodomus tracheiphilus IPT5]|uniref:Uncharacterized protein n=1 Tax=Plenodomus tracheiphilus IPT5 TaxID=1408161 RepID=A0A6A7AUY7_9PLEO|nr:hypothetical protein T440DRAFT_252685 [Plenodomus tracheiphilus IPT5]